MAQQLAFPQRVPFLGPDGFLSPPWFQLLIGLWRRTGGAAGETSGIATTDGNVIPIGVAQVPTGTLIPFAGTFGGIPDGYLVADGRAVSRATYQQLFLVTGTQWGIGDGLTTFNLPPFAKGPIAFSAGAALLPVLSMVLWIIKT